MVGRVRGSLTTAMTMNGSSAIRISDTTLTEVTMTCRPPPKRVPRILTMASTPITAMVIAPRARM